MAPYTRKQARANKARTRFYEVKQRKFETLQAYGLRIKSSFEEMEKMNEIKCDESSLVLQYVITLYEEDIKKRMTKWFNYVLKKRPSNLKLAVAIHTAEELLWNVISGYE